MRDRAHALRHFEKLIELDEVVAERAGDGRAAGEIFADERLDHLILEALLEVDDVIRDAQELRDVAGVVDVVERTAAASGTVSGTSSGRRRWFQSCMVRPTTVSPRACSMPATTELSTPPDMATAMGPSDIAAGTGPSDIAAGTGPSDIAAGTGPSDIAVGTGPSDIAAGTGPSDIAAGTGPSDIEAGTGPSDIAAGTGPSDIEVGTGPSDIAAGTGPSDIAAGTGPSDIAAGTGPSDIAVGTGPSDIAAGTGPSDIEVGTGPSDPAKASEAVISGIGVSTANPAGHRPAPQRQVYELRSAV